MLLFGRQITEHGYRVYPGIELFSDILSNEMT